MTRAAVRCAACAIAGLTLSPAGDLALHAQQPPPTAWRAFDGSWSASGSRQTIPTESGRVAAVAHLAGAVVLSNGIGVAAGFNAEAIGFDDSVSLTMGRAVWTDSAGDRIFSTLRGEPLQTGRRISATITGGTGRWARVTGDYELTWQYVISTEGGDLQGRSVDLRGRLRWAEDRP
jgi:hypothetical protein